jgi:DNA-binding transcriptional regulator YiaG
MSGHSFSHTATAANGVDVMPRKWPTLNSVAVDQCVGAHLMVIRTKAGLSVKELAKTLHCTERSLLDWEEGLSRIPPEMLLRIGRLFDVPLRSFFEGLGI